MPLDEASNEGKGFQGATLPHLQYWLLTPGEDLGYTPFQGFGLDIADRSFADLIDILAVLPALSIEVFLPPQSLPRLRLPIPQKRASIVGLPSFRALQDNFSEERAISIVIGLPDQILAAQEFVRGDSVIFVTTTPVKGAVCISEHDGHPAQLLDSPIRNALAMQLPVEQQDAIMTAPLRKPFPKGTEPSRIAGVTSANETLSIALGYAYSGEDPIRPSDKDAYVDAIVASVARARTLVGESATDVVLYAPSIVRHLYAFGSSFWNKLFRRIASRNVRNVIKDGIFRNPEYSGITMEGVNSSVIQDLHEDPVAAPLVAMRQTELRLTAAGIGALAASGMQPALRLPNSVNFHAPILREIERHSNRADPRGLRLLQQNYIKLVDALHNRINPKILEDLRSNAGAITVVSDAPLEWMRVGDLPLMIRHELSRIGMTPGNLMLHQCIHSGMLIVATDALEDILVVRSFSENDPIRHVLEMAIEVFKMKRLRVRFVDVKDRAELVASLNEFRGNLVVFDCHGDHGGDDSHGWLKIGQEKVDPWNLAHEARVPPIVVLSACSTFALAGSHASVANGLIRSGAITVIGTFLPVNAVRSATFVARLLYRMDEFLPALKATGRNFVTWRTLVSTFLRMSYTTDLLHFFIENKQWLHDEMLTRIGIEANYDINNLRPDWYARMRRRIAWASHRTEFDIQSAIEAESPLMETMYYCQIGRPELIGIYLGDAPIDNAPPSRS